MAVILQSPNTQQAIIWANNVQRRIYASLGQRKWTRLRIAVDHKCKYIGIFTWDLLQYGLSVRNLSQTQISRTRRRP